MNRVIGVAVIVIVLSAILSAQAQNKEQSLKTEHPVWVRIILDDEFSNKGEAWQLAQAIYGDVTSLVAPGKPDDLFGFGCGVIEKTGGLPIEAFRKKYGEGKIETSDKGVTYYCFGPLSLGFKSGDKYFTWFRAPNRMFREGFVKTAKAGPR